MLVQLPHIEIDSTSDDTLKTGSYSILQYVRPTWNSNDIYMKIYTEGITNKLIGAWNKTNPDDQILVRVYGHKSELFIDRAAETKNIQILYEHGCGPKLYAIFKNGISYEFFHGIPLSTDAIRETQIWKAVGQQMAKLHKIQIDTKEAFLFQKMWHFFSLLPESWSSDKQQRLDDAGIDRDFVKGEISLLETTLTALKCPVVFSHNDILLTNIIWNEDKGTANFIDYEYGAPNFQAFDIGNHFAEFAGLDTVDYSLYPDFAFQRKWLRNYLSKYYSKPEDEVTTKDIEKWLTWVNKFALAAHLFWGLWGFVQACHSTIRFDYLGYGIVRLQEYLRRKEEFLML